MKKNDWLLLGAVALYTFLFYQQSAGINFFLFGMAMVIIQLIRTIALLKQSEWRWAAIGTLFSGAAVAYLGTELSVWAQVISLSLLAVWSVRPETSILLGFIQSLYSYASAPVWMLIDWMARRAERAETGKRGRGRILIPLAITLLFFLLYRLANPLFDHWVREINLDFISWGLCFFALGGLILLYGFFYFRSVYLLDPLDQKTGFLAATGKQESRLFGKTIALSDELYTGKWLFICLNLLVLFINVLDVQFLCFGQQLPAGMSYAEFLHQGVGALILSILLAVGTLLFYFRGELNFHPQNKTLKLLAYAWVVQNALMLLSAALRNQLYVDAYGFTYKRIGVYIYLLLALIGFITVFIKLLQNRNNAYLFRANAWVAYAVFVLSAAWNWDTFIAQYNLHTVAKHDQSYLLELSDAALPQLAAIKTDSILVKENEGWDEEIVTVGDKQVSKKINKDSLLHKLSDERVSRRCYDFMDRYRRLDWQSYNWSDKHVYHELLEAHKKGELNSLCLNNAYFSDLAAIAPFTGLKKLELHNNRIWDIRELTRFPQVEYLDLSNNKLISIAGIERCKNLQCLYLSGNPVQEYSVLTKIPQLKKLSVSKSIPQKQWQALQAALPHVQITKN